MYYYTIHYLNQIMEVFLYVFSIIFILKIKKNKLIYFISSIIINLFICFMISQYKIRDLTLPISLISINILLLKIFKKDFSLKDLSFILLNYLCYLFSVYIIMTIVTSLYHVTPMQFIAYNNQNSLMNLVFLSKILFILILIIIKISKLIDIKYKINDGFVIIFLIVNIVVIFYYIKSMFMSYYNPALIFEYIKNIGILVLIMYCLSLVLNLYKNDFIKSLQEQNTKVLKDYQKDNLNNLKRIKRDIENKEHRMNYILQSIEYDLHHQQYDDAIKKLNIVKELVSNIEPVIYSENEMFDFMINLELKQLHINHKTIKVAVFISKNDCFNAYSVWNTLVEMIRKCSEISDYFELFIVEKNGNLEVKFIVHSYEHYDIKQLFDHINVNINFKYIDSLLSITYNQKL